MRATGGSSLAGLSFRTLLGRIGYSLDFQVRLPSKPAVLTVSWLGRFGSCREGARGYVAAEIKGGGYDTSENPCRAPKHCGLCAFDCLHVCRNRRVACAGWQAD